MSLALLALAVLPFLPALRGGEIFDDRRIHEDSAIGRLVGRGGRGAHGGRAWYQFDRLLTRLTHWATKRSPVIDHGFNIAVHLVTVQLVYGILGLALSPEKAVLAAAVFAVHPLQVHSVGYVGARAGLLSFFFAALIVRVIVSGTLWGILLVPLLAFLGQTTKEDFGVYLFAIAAGAVWITWG